MVERRSTFCHGHVAVEIETASSDRFKQLEVLPGRSEQLLCRLLKLAQSSLHEPENGQNESAPKAEQGAPLFQRAAGLYRG